MSNTGFSIERSLHIAASPEKVWEVLTDPEQMKTWVTDSELAVFSERKTGGRLQFKGDLHGIDYEDNGTILIFEIGRLLRYTHLSKISELPDVPENYSMITFTLTPEGSGTALKLQQDNFVTFAIFKHWEFYWSATLMLIKRICET